MKQLIIFLIGFSAVACGPKTTKTSKMEKATIIEMVLWKVKEGVTIQGGKDAIVKLNDCVKNMPGFIGRKTALADDNQFIDIVLWTDLESAKSASQKVMADESLIPVFSTINENEMLFKHFEIFNELN